jgi:hypothetical protein
MTFSRFICQWNKILSVSQGLHQVELTPHAL